MSGDILKRIARREIIQEQVQGREALCDGAYAPLIRAEEDACHLRPKVSSALLDMCNSVGLLMRIQEHVVLPEKLNAEINLFLSQN